MTDRRRSPLNLTVLLGAVEAALIAALTGFGLSDGIAVSAVLALRLATFWLPIPPGWLTFAWMQRNGEL